MMLAWYAVILAALLGACTSSETLASSLRVVYYTNELALDDVETWRHLVRAFDGEDSSVHFKVEQCLPETSDVCDGLCDSRIIHKDDEVAFTYYGFETDFHSVMRYAIHRLNAFGCSRTNLHTCTSESAFAETALIKTEEELNDLEKSLSDRVQVYKYTENLGSVVRQYVLVEALLSDMTINKVQLKRTEKESSFLAWLSSTGTYVGPCVWPVQTDHGRGVKAHRNIKVNDILFETKGIVLTPSLARAYFNITSDSTRAPDDGWDPFFQLVAFITAQVELGDKSAFYPYLSMLRETVDAGIYEWSEEELNALEDPKFVQGLNAIKKLQADRFAEWGDRLRLSKAHWHFDVFQWAFHVVTSRAFQLQETTILVFLDMLNHSDEHGQEVKFVHDEHGTISVLATQEVRRGDEILIKYTSDIAHLLYAYGFVPRQQGCLRHHDDGSKASFIEYYKCAKYRAANNLS